MKKNIFANAFDLSSTFAKYSHTSLRTFLVPLYFFLILCFSLLFCPFFVLLRIVGIDKEPPYKKLEVDLEAKWHTESSSSALLSLRKWHDDIKNHPSLMTFRGAYFAPYGRFKFNDYLKVNNLLYRWELQHHNFGEANNICDENLLIYKKLENYKFKESFRYWVLQKAHILHALKGKTAAQEYLLEQIDTKNKNCPISKRLQELRVNNEDQI